MVNFVDVVLRAEKGKMMDLNDFNMNVLAKSIRELLQETDIKFDPSEPVNTDKSVADEIWELGYRLFLKTGIYSINTRRLITFEEWEVKHALKNATDKLELGEGKDKRILFHRNVEDSRKPIIFGGPFNCDVSEDIFVRFNEAYAREEIIDLLELPGYIREMYGEIVRPESAIAVYKAIKYAQGAREAISRAGRPGMPIVGFAEMAMHDVAMDIDERGLRKFDPVVIMIISELQMDDVGFGRIAYFKYRGHPIYIAGTPLVGGFAGGPVGTAILGVATHIAELMLGADILHMGPQHIKYKSQTNIHSLWYASRAKQAIARHTKLINLTSFTESGRPGSKQFMYEIAALATSVVPSGSHVAGPRPADPKFDNHNSPLMARFLGEVAHAASKFKLETANEIVKTLYEKYKDKLDFEVAPVGKPFEELYDLNTLKPRPEHYNQYLEVKKELMDLGFEFDEMYE